MWPKIQHESDSYLLAINYAIGKNAYFEDDIAEKLGDILIIEYPLLLKLRYQFESHNMDGFKLLEWIAMKKGIPIRNKNLDIEKAAMILLNDYRQGLLGKISLESPKSRESTIDK
jgi:ribosome biogenesis GTPase A